MQRTYATVELIYATIYLELILSTEAESNEPAFLRKLRSGIRSDDSGGFERPTARPRKHVRTCDEEDEPTYVVEGSQDTIPKEQYHALIKGPQSEKLMKQQLAVSKDRENSNQTGLARNHINVAIAEQTVTIGSTSKKRLAKAIGGGDEKGTAEDHETHHDKKENKTKKGKKVKLSFDNGTD